ncbi:MAG: 50S ribosomal protein L2 [Candidatus Aenigmarchaeota archaeon]|nr:50S ribosomal protein L2 [Candidatus Aenigmarchaeota archaeon]
MGKRIIQQRRGKGNSTYRAPSHRYAGKISYPRGEGMVIDIIHDPARNAPLAKIRLESGKEILIVAAEGLKVGDKITGKVPKIGEVLSLSQIPKSSYIFAIENRPGSGPKLCCASGTHAVLVSQEKDKVIIQMPSKEFKNFHPNCLATIGVPAGAGQRDKPLLRAGSSYFKHKAKNKLWPRTSSVAMNAVDHPFGGSAKPGIPKSTPRSAPPGAKVGSIASRRTGRTKKK